MKHHVLKKKLEKKGWHEKHISHAIETFIKAEEKKHPMLVKLDRNLGWIALLVSIVINLVVAFALIPLYLTMPTILVIVCIFFFGTCFGLLIDIFIRETDYFLYHHYIIAGIFIPAVSIITVYYTLRLSNIISVYFPAAKSHNLFIVVFTYMISFSLPHIIYKYFEIKETTSE
ncbi:hypothetical protein JXB41_00905 [Candidatus Woesearchaeota archaeon]|nr:hypothetical protein [Candidatus Woesearchaeota archaeon]